MKKIFEALYLIGAMILLGSLLGGIQLLEKYTRNVIVLEEIE